MGERGHGSASLNRAVFVDRDGVLNHAPTRDGKPLSPESVEEFELLAGVPESVRRLRAAGFRVIVATNQPDVGRGRVGREVVEAMHARLRDLTDVDDIRVCYHDDAARCVCRKPQPGLLLDAARDWSIDLERSFMVGDRWRDIEAGEAVGARTVFVDRGYAEKRPAAPAAVVASFAEATDWILSRDSERDG